MIYEKDSVDFKIIKRLHREGERHYFEVRFIGKSIAGTTIILFWFPFFSILIATSTAVDMIAANQTIKDDGNNTIGSASGVFELGFSAPVAPRIDTWVHVTRRYQTGQFYGLLIEKLHLLILQGS